MPHDRTSGVATTETESSRAPQLDLASINSKSPKDNSTDITVESKAGLKLPAALQWIPANGQDWAKMKPVLRAALSAWMSAVLFVIPRVELFMGQASFLILIASVLSPPLEPLITVLEREMIVLFIVTVTWAWSCLGIRLADLARIRRDFTPETRQVYAGNYIETAPTIILAIFVFIGTYCLLYIKARQGPGPYLVATVLGCICLDICLTIAALYPFPLYLIGSAVLLPLSFHAAIAILCSLLIFPQSVAAQFTTRLQAVLTPLCTTMAQHRELLRLAKDSKWSDDGSSGGEAFDATHKSLAANVASSEAALIPLAASTRLLSADLVFGRFAPTDLHALHKLARRLAVRANGMHVYFTLFKGEKFPVAPASSPASRVVSPVTTPIATPVHSRQPSLERGEKGEPPRAPHQRSGPRVHILPFHLPHSHHWHKHHHDVTPETPVGVFESQRYVLLQMNLDLKPSIYHTKHNIQNSALLDACCSPLLDACKSAIHEVHDWLANVRRGALFAWLFQSAAKHQTQYEKRLAAIQLIRGELDTAITIFRDVERHQVSARYAPAFEPNSTEESAKSVPPYKYLFQAHVYQYHLLEFSRLLLSMLDEILRLEKDRTSFQLWTPARNLFSWSNWQASETMEHDEDENPDLVQGIDPQVVDELELDLGVAHRRDPDSLPPRNMPERLINRVYRVVTHLGRGNSLFAFKGAVLTVVLCIPALLHSTAQFAYNNHFVWGIFMGQLTISRFRGDTISGLVSRIYATFLGALLGMVMWYISTGSGRGTPFGLAAVFGVAFVPMFFARAYFPGPPIGITILLVTSILVVGYSYQSQHIILPNAFFGWDVAWRRFVLVVIGVVAASIFSFFPPSTTLRTYHRRSISTTAFEIGSIYCSIVSYANKPDMDTQDIVTSLIAIRSKLKRNIALRANIYYEISLRGRWPEKNYHTIVDLQLQIAYSLSHLMSVVEHLEPEWAHAFLRRTSFLDSHFQGDVLAVISLIGSALRSGTPLPMITPCPLLDRFLISHQHGLNISHGESEEDSRLPRTLSIDTLRNEQYMFFTVAISTAFGIVTRLDRLLIAVKEVVGEQYHIHGVGLDPLSFSPRGREEGRNHSLSAPTEV